MSASINPTQHCGDQSSPYMPATMTSRSIGHKHDSDGDISSFYFPDCVADCRSAIDGNLFIDNDVIGREQVHASQHQHLDLGESHHRTIDAGTSIAHISNRIGFGASSFPSLQDLPPSSSAVSHRSSLCSTTLNPISAAIATTQDDLKTTITLLPNHSGQLRRQRQRQRRRQVDFPLHCGGSQRNRRSREQETRARRRSWSGGDVVCGRAGEASGQV